MSSNFIPKLLYTACNLEKFIDINKEGINIGRSKYTYSKICYYSAIFFEEGVLELVTFAFHFLCWSIFLLISIRITFSTLTRALLSLFFAHVFSLVIVRVYKV